ncbi:E3 ubiquitin-protein ligase RMA1H1-like [Quillaja saponaria]|uniref:E3 ubiquitin-protein ligase RMA n=1 Tax=Quillaja saponaria TaxID=32244 RepID=A0AAD7VN41_QUISA|nr:E3 ubiquitin-protein ligase RMA1H1-like [Quillaja saponaria]
MALDRYFEEPVAQIDSFEEDTSSFVKWKTVTDTVPDSVEDASGGFECNICLDSVQDPVVTLCGHLYCWPCIYKWLHLQNISAENEDQLPQCPVCKAEVSKSSIVPLYGRGKTTKASEGKAANLGIDIPQRPPGPACGVVTPRSANFMTSPQTATQFYQRHYPYQTQLFNTIPGNNSSPMLRSDSSTPTVFDSTVGMFGEMIYARVFGNSVRNMYTYPNTYYIAGSNSPRIRRHIMQADKSLSRICIFLFCCLILCLLLF